MINEDHDKEATETEDEHNKGSLNVVEMRFNKILHKFTHSDYFPNHRPL